MLSRKVACAIIILNELYSSQPDAKTGTKMVRRAVLAQNSGHDIQMFRRVIQGLHMGGFLFMVNSNITLTCDLTTVSVYDLFVSLHGGIPLGEEHVLDLGDNYYADKECSNIELLQ